MNPLSLWVQCGTPHTSYYTHSHSHSPYIVLHPLPLPPAHPSGPGICDLPAVNCRWVPTFAQCTVAACRCSHFQARSCAAKHTTCEVQLFYIAQQLSQPLGTAGSAAACPVSTHSMHSIWPDHAPVLQHRHWPHSMLLLCVWTHQHVSCPAAGERLNLHVGSGCAGLRPSHSLQTLCYCSVYGRTNTYAAQLLVDGSTCMLAVAVRDCANWTPVMLPPAHEPQHTSLCSVSQPGNAHQYEGQHSHAAALCLTTECIQPPSCQTNMFS